MGLSESLERDVQLYLFIYLFNSSYIQVSNSIYIPFLFSFFLHRMTGNLEPEVVDILDGASSYYNNSHHALEAIQRFQSVYGTCI